MGNFRAGGALDRRRFLTAAGTVGITSLAWPPTTGATVSPSSRRPRLRLPNPIPGGNELAPGVVIHVFAAGDPAVTLPFTGFTLQGLDHEPSTITDFNGSTAVAYHVGTARANDGRTYNLETDIRAFEGEYIAEGAVHRGAFALVWIDLFDPGSGSQMHDFNGGILPSGLFWTLDVGKSAVDFTFDGRRARLHVQNLPVIDTFQFFGPNDTPALVDFRVEWEATGPGVPQGMGAAVGPTDPRAFLGEIAPAVSRGSFAGEEMGFEFESNRGTSTSPHGYAQIGTERNGAFL